MTDIPSAEALFGTVTPAPTDNEKDEVFAQLAEQFDDIILNLRALVDSAPYPGKRLLWFEIDTIDDSPEQEWNVDSDSKECVECIELTIIMMSANKPALRLRLDRRQALRLATQLKQY